MTSPLTTALRNHAARDPGARCLADDNACLSRADVLARLMSTARDLRGLGTAALLADNGVDWVVTALAALEADVTLVPIPPFFTPEQRHHVLRSVRPAAWIGASAPDAPTTSAPVPLAGTSLCVTHLPEPRAPLATTARVSFTSGSTGTPKGICLSARALTAVAASLADATGFGSDDTHVCTLPLAVLLDEVAGPWRCLLAGARCVVPALGSADAGSAHAGDDPGPALVRSLTRHGATGAVFVPAMLADVVAALETGLPAPPRLTLVGVGGAAVPTALLERARAVGLPVREGYGLSEAGSVVALDRGPQPSPGRVGRPLDHVRTAVSPDGELLVGGPGLAHGWLDAHGRVHELPLRDGLYATGDLVSREIDGALRIRGRKRNVFITSYGRNVSPEWIERRLLEHADVLQAAVFGEGLSAPRAIVVARGNDSSLEDVRHAVNAGLPTYAQLDRIIPARAPFDVANGLWAATDRPRRDAIARAYADALQSPDPTPLFSPDSQEALP